jgi:hypothetical protein
MDNVVVGAVFICWFQLFMCCWSTNAAYSSHGWLTIDSWLFRRSKLFWVFRNFLLIRCWAAPASLKQNNKYQHTTFHRGKDLQVCVCFETKLEFGKGGHYVKIGDATCTNETKRCHFFVNEEQSAHHHEQRAPNSWKNWAFPVCSNCVLLVKVSNKPMRTLQMMR